MTRTVVFDITDIAAYLASGQTVTGIQRAALMIMRHAVREAGDTPLLLAWRQGRDGAYRVHPAAPLGELETFDLAEIGAALDLPVGRDTGAPPTLKRYARKPVKTFFHALKRDWAAWRGDEAHFTRRGSSISEWTAWRARHPILGRPPQQSVDAQRWVPYDEHPLTAGGAPHRIFVLGALWNSPEMTGFFADLASRGVPVGVFIHDLIPLIRADWFDPVLPRLVYDWLVSSRGYVDLYLANSDSTASDLRRFFAEMDASPAIETVPLAQAGFFPGRDEREIGAAPGAKPLHPAAPAHAGRTARIERASRLHADTKAATRMPYALSVGTIETRKNLWRLVQAWLRIGSAHPDAPRLVLAGKPGWLNDDLLDAIEATGGFGGRVVLVEGPSDADLDYLYRNCEFTATVSLYEGWGLPIGEGLAYGKTGIVSDVSSMPEVGGDMVAYCDPRSIASIEAAALSLIEGDLRAELEARIADTALRGWDDVARGVLEALARADGAAALPGPAPAVAAQTTLAGTA